MKKTALLATLGICIYGQPAASLSSFYIQANVLALYCTANWAKKEYQKSQTEYTRTTKPFSTTTLATGGDSCHALPKSWAVSLKKFLPNKPEFFYKVQFAWKNSPRFKLYALLAGLFSLKLFNRIIEYTNALV